MRPVAPYSLMPPLVPDGDARAHQLADGGTIHIRHVREIEDELRRAFGEQRRDPLLGDAVVVVAGHPALEVEDGDDTDGALGDLHLCRLQSRLRETAPL